MSDTRTPIDPAAVKRPEPVLDAAALAGKLAAALIALAAVLRALGIVLPFDVQEVADQASIFVLAAAGLWAVVGPWLTARLRARDKTTPLEDPRDAQGNPLFPDLPGRHAADA